MCGWERLSEIFGSGAAGSGDRFEVPEAFAGHSLGEVAALVAAGAIDLEQAVHLVHLRGDVMSGRSRGPRAVRWRR